MRIHGGSRPARFAATTAVLFGFALAPAAMSVAANGAPPRCGYTLCPSPTGVPSVTPSAAPSASASTAPSTSDVPELPVTGTHVLTLIGIGLILFGLGALIVVVAREARR